MKVLLPIIFLLLLTGCNQKRQPEDHKASANQSLEKGNLSVNTAEPGAIYLNGEYTGLTTPAVLQVEEGQHRIGVGLLESRQYLKRSITVDDKLTTVTLTDSDKIEPNIWKALFVGVPVASGMSENGQCQTTFSETDLDHAYDFFKMNLREHIEPFSFGAVKWQIARRDLTRPVELHHNPKNGWYTLEAEQGLAELTDISPGDYDNIFLFWREQQADCSFKSGYFGLAWLEPTSQRSKKTGYVTVKFNPLDSGVEARIQEYLKEDPGVWTHEWLHVVIEKFYPERGVKTPIPPKDKLILHAAEAYGYTFPWIDWYEDLISGQVPLGKGFSGIGPEALNSCNIRQAVKGACDSTLK